MLLPSLLTLLMLAAPQASVEPDPGWNSPRVMELVAQARAARRQAQVEEDLQSYRALTEGHIYFFVDPEEGERALIRVDQVAVELFWEAPNLVRQRIVGERSETRLPVRDFRYYLDRLTLVQYGFGDEIQVGQGLDVAGVPHPLAPLPDGSPEEAPYDYRLGDSLTLTLFGAPEPVRIQEVEVRPRDPSAPGVVGTLQISRSDGQLVRMEFTFTPPSYVDRRTDRVAVELDYGLWDGRHWLPNRQQIEVRREIPELDIGVGTVIRAILRVGDYRFNEPIPPEVLMAPPVTALPQSMRETYPFQEGLFEAMERDGLAEVATRADPRELRAEATRLLRNRPPSGLSPIRLHLPSISSLAAYDRTRGLDIGGGLSFRPAGTLQLRTSIGWAFASGLPRGEIALEGMTSDPWVTSLRIRVNGREELGAAPAIAPFLGSAGALTLGEDYTDPWRVSGWAFRMERLLPPGGRARVEMGVERHASEALRVESAPLATERSFRPVLPVTETWLARSRVDWWTPPGWEIAGGRTALKSSGEILVGDLGASVRLDADGRVHWRSPTGDREAEVRLRAGRRFGDPIAQHRRLLGGRGTIPGFPFHAFAGDTHVLGSAEGGVDLGSPLIRARGGIHTGWIGGGEAAGWDLPGSRNVRVGVTAGVGLLFDLLRVEGARGLNGGEWQLLLSVDPRWWDWL